jgi:hypothetical protein
MSQPAGLARLLGMMKWFIRKRLAAFEKEFGYDASYMRHVLDTDFGAFMRFARMASAAKYRKDVPLDLYTAVGLVGVLTADCGPLPSSGSPWHCAKAYPRSRSQRSCAETRTR